MASNGLLAHTCLGSAFCALTRQSQKSFVSCMQAQQEVQLGGAARNSPLQVPLIIEEPQATEASSDPASHGNANGLMREAAEAVHQVPHVDVFTNAFCDSVIVTCLDHCGDQSVLRCEGLIIVWTKAFFNVKVGQGRVTVTLHGAVC